MIEWLLQGDPVIQYQVKRDLLGVKDETLKDQMLKEGWVKCYLDKQKPEGHWGDRFYQPKWISSHYTLLDLCLFEAPKLNRIKNEIEKILLHEKGTDNGINPHNTLGPSDVCINGMFLNYASYFGIDEPKLHVIVDFIISQKMIDGAFNCRLNRSGASHSSVHTTICVLEGLERYKQEGYTYRLKELTELQDSSEEFLLQHHLYKSDKTGQVIHKNMLVFSYPSRYKYNILRALDYFRWAGRPYDKRMDQALEVLASKCKKGKWMVASKHPGQEHMKLEPSRQASRMVTLMALRVQKKYPQL